MKDNAQSVGGGLQPFPLVVYGTIGNVAGSLFNYGVGHMGKVEWIERYLHVSKEKLDKAEKFMGGHGAWMGFFAFIPLLGSAITILLGLMKANFFISLLSITIGKFGRYLILVYGACMFQMKTSTFQCGLNMGLRKYQSL